ncbi:nodulation protein NodH [Rhodobacter sp. NSM]|uniref:nodulation protein NodH n=1 Tax=Rhodobacter sp. NSM TaxID=3457501 RepID=UPI003FD12C72
MFDSFVMLAGMRTGSNFLEANLNALPGVRCHGELFNPYFIGTKGCTELFGTTIAQRAADPLGFLARVRAETPGLAGLRFFHDHDARVLPVLLEDRRCAKILLVRNPIESYVSLRIARETGQWKLTDPKRRKVAKVTFDPAEFEAHLAVGEAFHRETIRALQVTGQTPFVIDYADLSDLDVLNGLAAFLGCDTRLTAPDETLKKQNPAPVTDLVSNPDEMHEALARLDPFGLSRPVSYEPRRGAGVPAFLAAGPLLYLPLRGGLEDEVRGWLEKAAGEVTDGFTQKLLRQWKRSHPGHRSFTVLRHPLVRAHATFRDQVLTAALPELRLAFLRHGGINLPKPGAPLDAERFRATFLAFLRFLKPALAGQTPLRIGAAVASQHAVLQGMAQVEAPDFLFREERLVEGLAFLASETGLTSGPFRTASDDGPAPLSEIWTPEIEEAAREAYQRDYTSFGFGPWRASGG